MPIETRKRSILPNPGPYIGRITNLFDTTFMGTVEVALEKGTADVTDLQSQTYTVNYLSPFYGVTNVLFEGTDPTSYDSVQKSYGMWFVPPDVGTRVLVIFIDGDPNQGYWIGCIPDKFQNQMIPGLASSMDVHITPAQELKYGTKNLPVAEFHKRSSKQFLSPNSQKKPIHPFADRLMAQGLLVDNIRGITSSSARREAPSAVFGISTPGPLDPNSSQRGTIGYETKQPIPVSRLGGTQFVMDDGDVDGQNELVRLRTRTGHQILLHNSSDLIYIANSKGTAWIELTSNGKIDIYAQDSISIHTENDFNFRADRDINLEAGRNINVNANGGMEINCTNRFYLICDANGKINIGGELNITSGSDLKVKSGATTNFTSVSDMKLTSSASLNLKASGNILETGAAIHLNSSGNPASTATEPEIPAKLVSFTLPNRSSTYGWTGGQWYKAPDISSIMQRVPTHEPWDHHENTNPSSYTPDKTDVAVNSTTDVAPKPTVPLTTSTGNTTTVAQPSTTNVTSNEIYLQSMLINAGLTDPIKLAAWMAQCKVESDNFRALREYASGAEYEGRRDLGNIYPGDGVKYKGRGFIQLTGRNVYKSMTKFFKAGIDFEQNPELVETLEWAARSVIYFFNSYKPKGFKNKTMTQSYQDIEAFWDDCPSVSALVNGGTNGLAKRQQYYSEYKAKFQSEGIYPKGVVRTSSGVLTDSYGNPVTTKL